ncbi:MAG: hypothetical protein AAFS10_09710 [Myxococcota bacterium]
MSHLSLSLVLTAFALATIAATAQPSEAQETPERPKLETLDDLLDLIEGWDGSPEELQKLYEQLDPDERKLVDGNFESWSVEGGLGLLGGARLTLGDDGNTDGIFRLSGTIGAVWPVGDYSMPIYYAFPDIPGPWAIGFQVLAATDNFDSFVGGLLMRWAYDYIGSTPSIEIGPAVRVGDDTLLGGHLSVGYGNILIQGYVEAEYFFGDEGPLIVVAGLRLPWLLATLLGED